MHLLADFWTFTGNLLGNLFFAGLVGCLGFGAGYWFRDRKGK